MKKNFPAKYYKRISADTLLFSAVYLLPWWISVPLAAVFIFFFSRYYEYFGAVIAVFFLYAGFLPFFRLSWLLLLSIPLYYFLEMLKKRLTFYAS